jgi:hypothetical protein
MPDHPNHEDPSRYRAGGIFQNTRPEIERGEERSAQDSLTFRPLFRSGPISVEPDIVQREVLPIPDPPSLEPYRRVYDPNPWANDERMYRFEMPKRRNYSDYVASVISIVKTTYSGVIFNFAIRQGYDSGHDEKRTADNVIKDSIQRIAIASASKKSE